jgi:hypothetical protein
MPYSERYGGVGEAVTEQSCRTECGERGIKELIIRLVDSSNHDSQNWLLPHPI